MQSEYRTFKNKMTIHTLIAGNESSPPLVLLHGWPASALLWRRLIPELAKHFYVLVPDLPGYGKSDKPGNVVHDLQFYRNFILDFWDTFHLKTAHLAVHDIGGMAGLSVAVHHPELIEKLIVMNTSPFPQWSYRLRFIIYLLKQRYLTWLFLSPFVFKQVLKTAFYRPDLITPEVLDIFRAPWVESKEAKIAFSKTIAVPPELMVESRENLKVISAPTLIIWGAKDIFFPLNVARELNDHIQNSDLFIVKKARHFLQEEQPGVIVEKMVRFLSDEHPE